MGKFLEVDLVEVGVVSLHFDSECHPPSWKAKGIYAPTSGTGKHSFPHAAITLK